MSICRPNSLIRNQPPKRIKIWIVLLVLTLLGSIILQSCRTYPAPPMLTSIEELACGKSNDDLEVTLPDLDDEAAKGIKVEICLRGGKDLYRVETYPLAEEEKKNAKKISSDFDITAIYAYFKVIDVQTGKEVTKFSPPLLLRVSYTPAAWAAIEERGFTEPRAAFLTRSNGKWADNWEEIIPDQISTPGASNALDQKGYFEILIYKLKDPLIGGC